MINTSATNNMRNMINEQMDLVKLLQLYIAIFEYNTNPTLRNPNDYLDNTSPVFKSKLISMKQSGALWDDYIKEFERGANQFKTFKSEDVLNYTQSIKLVHYLQLYLAMHALNSGMALSFQNVDEYKAFKKSCFEEWTVSEIESKTWDEFVIEASKNGIDKVKSSPEIIEKMKLLKQQLDKEKF